MTSESREKYIRISTILEPFSGMDKIDPEIVANAARRGTQVHLICEAIATGFGDVGVDDETAPYIKSFMYWWDTSPEVISMEERLYDDELQITGKFDFLIKTKDGLAIIDLKTSYQESKTWPVQGNAYAYLASKSGYDIKKIYFIHLKRDGSPPRIYDYPVDHSLFLDTYRIYKHFYYTKNSWKKNGKIEPQDAKALG